MCVQRLRAHARARACGTLTFPLARSERVLRCLAHAPNELGASSGGGVLRGRRRGAYDFFRAVWTARAGADDAAETNAARLQPLRRSRARHLAHTAPIHARTA